MFEYWAIQASGESEPTGLFRVVRNGGMTPEHMGSVVTKVSDYIILLRTLFFP